jgi:hypothetical protein
MKGLSLNWVWAELRSAHKYMSWTKFGLYWVYKRKFSQLILRLIKNSRPFSRVPSLYWNVRKDVKPILNMHGSRFSLYLVCAEQQWTFKLYWVWLKLMLIMHGRTFTQYMIWQHHKVSLTTSPAVQYVHGHTGRVQFCQSLAVWTCRVSLRHHQYGHKGTMILTLFYTPPVRLPCTDDENIILVTFFKNPKWELWAEKDSAPLILLNHMAW